MKGEEESDGGAVTKHNGLTKSKPSGAADETRRSNWCCPECDSSSVFHETGRIFLCLTCGLPTVEGQLHTGARS